MPPLKAMMLVCLLFPDTQVMPLLKPMLGRFCRYCFLEEQVVRPLKPHDGVFRIWTTCRQVDGSCNVNWVQYRPIGNGPGATLLATLGRFLAYFVVLFPAMDVTSVYPLNVMVSLTAVFAAPALV